MIFIELNEKINITLKLKINRIKLNRLVAGRDHGQLKCICAVLSP